MTSIYYCFFAQTRIRCPVWKMVLPMIAKGTFPFSLKHQAKNVPNNTIIAFLDKENIHRNLPKKFRALVHSGLYSLFPYCPNFCNEIATGISLQYIFLNKYNKLCQIGKSVWCNF